MKTLLLAATTVVVAASLLSSCKTDPSSANGPQAILPLNSHGGGSAPAHPQLVYVGGKTISHNQYETIAVMDSDGSHQTTLYTAPASISGTTYACANLKAACWSPSGGSIAWLEADTIKALDVTVNSSGVPVASNIRVIYTNGGSETMNGLAWCSGTSTSALAFTAYHAGPTSELYTVPQSGGSATTIASETSGGVFSSPTWSPDDSKIGTMQIIAGTSGECKLWVLSASGSLLETDTFSTLAQTKNCEWARSGNTIAFGGQETGGAQHVYYIDYGSGTGPYTQSVTGDMPSWNPTNATIMFTNISASPWSLQKITAFGSSASTITTTPALNAGCRWRRQ